MLIVGDLSHRIVDQLATLVDNIVAPLLTKAENHKDLPEIAIHDICKHVHALRGTLYQVIRQSITKSFKTLPFQIKSVIKKVLLSSTQVKGQVNGRTVLPMPAGLEKVAEVERLISVEGPQAADLYLKSAIEGVVIKWAYLVNDVVTHESSVAFENGQNPTPNIELEYWSTRLANLRY